jgi:hypothetical protein
LVTINVKERMKRNHKWNKRKGTDLSSQETYHHHGVPSIIKQQLIIKSITSMETLNSILDTTVIQALMHSGEDLKYLKVM